MCETYVERSKKFDGKDRKSSQFREEDSKTHIKKQKAKEELRSKMGRACTIVSSKNKFDPFPGTAEDVPAEAQPQLHESYSLEANETMVHKRD